MSANQAPLPAITLADFNDPALAAFLHDHIADLLPTGPPESSMEFFGPARALYSSFGFVECGPFGDYPDDPLSTFMTLELQQ